MATPPKKSQYMSQEELQSQCEKQDPVCLQEAMEKNDSSTNSPCSSTSSYSSSASFYTVSSSISEEELSPDETSGPSENPQDAGSSSTSMVSPPCNQSDQGSHQQSEEEPITSQALPPVGHCLYCDARDNVQELVKFLLLKYGAREQTTEAEILSRVTGSQQRYYPWIYSSASHCMLEVFGIEVKEGNLSEHSYVLVPALDLTYDGMLSDIQGVPKTGLLIKVLCIISLEGRSAREEVVWTALYNMGVCDENNLSIYGNARRLITEEFVQEGYLEYRQVPHSDPAHYEFLWGARALAETNQTKFSMFLRCIHRVDPIEYHILNA